MRNKVGEQIKREQKARAEQAKRPRERGYDARFATIARGVMMMGKDQTALAELLGVSPATITNWKNKHADFAQALECGRDMASAELAATAHLLAIGQYEHKDKLLVFDAKKGCLVEKTTHYKIPPDNQMLKFLLPKLAPEAFPEKQEVDLNVEGLDIELKVVRSDMG